MASSNGQSASTDLLPRDVCIVGVARTPMGSLMGSLSSFSAIQLGAIAIKEALNRSGIESENVEEVFMGNVLSANLGQSPARQAAMAALLPESVVCTTVNKVCASGMKATMLASQTIMLGSADVVIAGGMESMSNVPYYIPKARQGYKYGNAELIDGLYNDGLCDAYSNVAMGICAEICADDHKITREEQDDHAVMTNERAIAAHASDAFKWEIVPVEVKGARGKPNTVVDKDEGCQKFDAIKLRKLRPVFKDNGTVTPGNASGISDGAAAIVLVSGEFAKKHSLSVIAKIKGFADAAQNPNLFTTSPSLAIPKALKNSKIEKSNVDYYEINEAFSVVALANQKLLEIDQNKLNVNGGAVALGHPLGCSGARIIVTLLGVLRSNGGKIGVAGVCNGGGGASAIVIECA